MRQRISFITSSKLPRFNRIFDAAQHKGESLHVYRHLLRACTYLPDEFARTFIAAQAKERFRADQPKKRLWLRRARRRSAEATKLLQDQLDIARRDLNRLNNANDGCLQSLTWVLRITYGRIGPRREPLMKLLSIPDKDAPPAPWFPEPYTDLHPRLLYIFEPVSTLSVTDHKFDISPRFPMVKALASSQVRLGGDLERLNTAKLRTTYISVPKLNGWLAPMPWRRVKNQIRDQHARLMEQLHAPLPKDEWLRLSDLATGKVRWPGPVPRRKQARPEVPEKLSFRDVERLLFALDERDARVELPKRLYGTHVRMMDDSNMPAWMKKPEKLEEAAYQLLEQELGLSMRSALNYDKADTPHLITPRFMRRVWARVFEHCPLVEKNSKTGVWNVTWGAQVLKDKAERPVAGLGGLLDMALDRSTNPLNTLTMTVDKHFHPITNYKNRT